MNNNNSLQAAFTQLQSIFPTLTLRQLSTHQYTLEEKLNLVTRSLPVPESCNRSAALETMRQIIDQQQYKYQRSLLIQSQYQKISIFQEEECYYQQPSTGILNKKDTLYTHCQSNKCDMVDDVWGWKEDKIDQREEYLLFID